VTYKGVKLACGYKMDLLADDVVIVEFKTVETLLPVHSAQLLSYLRLSGKPVGLVINFNAAVLKSGLKRIVNQFSEDSASRRLGVEKPGLEDVTALS
jgi:GxxExxY protein